MNDREELSINELKRDVLLHVFSFLSSKELKTNRLVSKEFKHLNSTSLKTRINQTANQIFYTTGDPILISSPRSTGNKIIHTLFGAGYDALFINFRQNISATEIKCSFPPKQEKIRLFETEAEALTYSRCLRIIDDSNTHNGEKVYQPAIFKIQYLDRLDNITNESKTLLINKHNENDYFDRALIVDVKYFEADKSAIIPCLGILKIELNEKGKFKEYSPVKYISHLSDLNKDETDILSTLRSYIRF